MIYFALLAFFVFDYLRPGSYVPALDALRLNALVPLVAIIGTAFLKTPVSNREFFSETNTKLMAALLGMLVISTVFSEVTMTAYTVTKNVFAYMLVYWIIVRQVGSLDRLKGIFITLTLVHLAIAALNPAIFGTNERVGINSGGFLGDGNDFSLSINVCVPLCLFLLFNTKRKISRAVWASALLALVMCVVATKSRGGTLALAVVGFYYWIRSERKVMTATLAVLAVAFVLAVAPPTYFERMEMMTDTEEGSAQGRIMAWKQGVQMALGSPLIGVGPGHFPMAYGQANQGRWLTAHSIYFLLLGELGFPGLFVLLGLIGYNLAANRYLLIQARRLPPDERQTASNLLTSTSVSLVGFAVGGAFLSAAYYPHLYVLSGLLVAGRRVVNGMLAAESQAGEARQPAEPVTHVHRPVRPGAISPEWRPRELALGAAPANRGRAPGRLR